jgi:hypothetical protein
MYISKSFAGAIATCIIWLIVGIIFFEFRLGVSFSYFEVLTISIALIISYFVLRSIDKTYGRQPQTRVDRFLTTLNDAELDTLRDRLSGAPRHSYDGEYSSLDEVMIENEVKVKRR